MSPFLIDVSPLVLVVAVFSFFSFYQLPSREYSATATNSIGLFTGNFVYDGEWNTPFLFAGLLLIEATALRFAKGETRLITFSYPLIVIGSAVITGWLVFLTPFVKPLYCINCQVYGMSSVASASVGTAFASTAGVLIISVLRAGKRDVLGSEEWRSQQRRLFISFTLFVFSLAVLYLFTLSALIGKSAAVEFDHVGSLFLGMGFGFMTVLALNSDLLSRSTLPAGSQKLFFGTLGLTIIIIGLTSSTYPVQYQVYHPGEGWGGYVAFGNYNGSIGSVTGEWVVPSVNCSGITKGAVLFWVGMDGWRSKTVEQGGTRADCFNGLPQYSAWYEFYPLEPNTVNFTSMKIAPGNLVMATVKYLDGLFNITVANLSTHMYASVVGSYNKAARLDAEWIVEPPGYQNGTKLTLPSFGQVQFNDTYAIINGYSDSIGMAKNGTVVYDCTGNHYRLVPSTLNPGWTSFTVYSVGLAGC